MRSLECAKCTAIIRLLSTLIIGPANYSKRAGVYGSFAPRGCLEYNIHNEVMTLAKMIGEGNECGLKRLVG